VELTRSIKFDQRSHLLSVVCVLTPQQSPSSAALFEAGADDCIHCHAADSDLRPRLMRAVRLKRATDSLEDAQTVIAALAGAIEGKDHYTCGHVERVGDYSIAIGKRIGVDAEALAALRTGGVVHDIGKIGIPDQILNKPGKLTDEEMAIMKRHPVIGYDILRPLRTFRNVLPIVRWHHERPNGSGYPDGLAADDLPLLPRIAAVADCFDALSTDRPYRKAFSMPQCEQMLLESAQRGDLDSKVVDALFQIIRAGAMPMAQAA
jgi:putative two-component system response regulator